MTRDWNKRVCRSIVPNEEGLLMRRLGQHGGVEGGRRTGRREDGKEGREGLADDFKKASVLAQSRK